MKEMLIFALLMALTNYSSACSCTSNLDPVCGVNGQTYRNDCYAFCHGFMETGEGVEVKCKGRCPCSDQPDVCICTYQYDPMCGRNGQTYGNSCAAGCAGQAVQWTGKCPCSDKPWKMPLSKATKLIFLDLLLQETTWK